MLPYYNGEPFLLAKTFHGVSHTLDYRMGCPVKTLPVPQHEPLAQAAALQGSSATEPITFYGRVKKPIIPPFRPDYVQNNNKILRFNGYFRQKTESMGQPIELMRKVKILYFMEDDTITVIEPAIDNSGYAQGRIIRRSRIIKDPIQRSYFTWKDFNVGVEMCMFGITFHLLDCDAFTKEFLISHGIELNDFTLPTPETDPHPKKEGEPKQRACRPFTAPPLASRKSRLISFKSNENSILCFDCIRIEQSKPLSDCCSYKIFYYVDDETVAVKELKQNIEGRDYCPYLLRRMQVPKNHTNPINSLLRSVDADDDNIDYLKPDDFQIGKEVIILGHRFFLHDCDGFTRNYYENILKTPLDEKVEVKREYRAKQRIEWPAYTGFGTHEDSLASCKHLTPKEPRKNLIRYLLNANKHLRFGCKLDSNRAEDSNRRFTLKFSLADDKIEMHEIVADNSGRMGGKYLSSQLIRKPMSNPNVPEYYSSKDFYIGAVLHINARRFVITSTDRSAYEHMKQNPEFFSEEAIAGVRTYLVTCKGLKLDDNGDITSASNT